MKLLSKLKDAVVRKFLVGFLVDKLETLLAQLPLNERKTVVGLVVAVVAELVTEFPGAADYLGPFQDALSAFPAEAIAGGGVLIFAVGLFHKALKWIKLKAGLEPAIPKGVVVARIDDKG